MDLSFFNSLGAAVNHESDDASQAGGLFLSQESFNAILTLERKRTARSKRPFILMLLTADFEDGAKDSLLAAKLTPFLNSSIRNTDRIGWYLRNKVMGIIFTEIGEGPIQAAADIIVARVRESLYACLGPNAANMVRMSLFFYPEEYGDPADKFNPEPALYPDIAHRNSEKRVSLFVKRVIDVTGSIFIVLLMLPFMLVISVLIKLTSDGPVFFKQERIGRFGKRFNLLKFRSMHVNNDSSIHKQYVSKLITSDDTLPETDSTGQVYKITNDPRVTPIGRFIRKTSLDELPQLLNVLMGDMSLVGPRPPILYELDCYDIWHRRRVLEMKPGITGLWQVQGRSRTTFNEMVRLDIRYTKEWSLWLDIKLLFLTPWVVFMGKGAY